MSFPVPLYWGDIMTVKELIEALKKQPKDAIVMYRHNKYGRIDIDKVEYAEEELLFGHKIKTVTLEGESKES